MFKRDKVCTCLNGGRCIGLFFDVCECPVGFEGDRCQDVYIEFLQKPSTTDFKLIWVLGVTVVGILLTTLFCFFTCRKIKSMLQRRTEKANLRNRRQSRVTIEGFSVSGHETDNERISRAKFQLAVFQNSEKYCSNSRITRQEYSKLTKTELVINDEKFSFI